MLNVFKTMANLNVKERRKRQSGRFLAEFENAEYDCQLISQGTQSGERVILQVDRPQPPFKSMRELGLREKPEKKLTELEKSHKSYVAETVFRLTESQRVAKFLESKFFKVRASNKFDSQVKSSATKGDGFRK